MLHQTTNLKPKSKEEEAALKLATQDPDGSDNSNDDPEENDDKYISYKVSCNMQSAVGCLRCKEGFYVSPNGECSSCSPHCAFCDQTLGCLHCLGETVMVDGRCEYSGATSVLTLLILLILAFAI